jgi:hypothetical protein
MRSRMDSVEKARDAEWAKKHPERPRRCGSRGGTGGGQPSGPRPFL